MRMKIGIITALAALLIAGSSAIVAQEQQDKKGPPGPPPGMKLTSTGWKDGGDMIAKYTCLGEPNPVSPGLDWTNAPKGTQSYAVVMHDPDFTRDKGTADILLWMAWNLPGDSTHLAEGMKEGFEQGSIRQGNNVRNEHVYRGPCATATSHHFTLELFALDETLNLPATATRTDLYKVMEGHVLGKGVTVGLFHR